MTAFDTDALTAVMVGDATFVERAAAIPGHQQGVPIIVVEEIVRGRLNVIRQAEAGKSRISIDRAYELFEETIRDVRRRVEEEPVRFIARGSETILGLSELLSI